MMKKNSQCGKEMEIYSRVVGYYRPVQNWNKGKREEFALRRTFKVDSVEPKPARSVQVEQKSLFTI